jgi:hypothetical protein
MTLLLNKAKELCRAYGVADTNANNFTVFGLTVMAEMKNNKAKFDAMVVVNNNGDADKAARLCGLMTYLKDNGFFTDKNDAYTVLSGLNSRLVRQWVAPPCVCSRCKLQYWRALLEAMKVNGNHTALVVELLALDPNILCRFYPLFATISNQSHMKDVLLTFYRLRHECHVSAQRLNALLLKNDGLPVQVHKAWQLYSIGATFSGFASWGDGNHSSAQTNIVWHFYKHVCGVSETVIDQNGEEKDSPTFPDECAMWWRLLNIRIPEDVLHRCGDREWKSVKSLLIRGVDGSFYLDHTRAELFIRKGYLQAALPMYLFENYAAAYKQLAIDRSRQARRVYVEGTRARVFIDCFCDDDVFVVGRLNGHVFEISSCYILLKPAAKEQDIQRTAYWTL